MQAEGRRQVAVEIALVLAVFSLQGAWPVPDVNEPYYLGKAIHFWNPDWAAGDFFLDSADAHQVFYVTFGWLSLWLSPAALAWTGRLVTWALMAWAWRRLSVAMVPRRWFSILTASLFTCLVERCHMAGEWIVGGVEAKGFAYVLVFLGLEALARNRWNRVWLLFGAASAFHVLVGGWSVVAAGVAWIGLGKQRPTVRSMWPALLGGLVLSLPGLVPSASLTWGADADLVGRADMIYVFNRLAHHLVPACFPREYVWRFLLLLLLLVVLDYRTPPDGPRRRLRMFVVGTIAIACAGMAANLLVPLDAALAAKLLRFYWFRLSDVAVPLAVALFAACYLTHLLATRPRAGKWALALAIGIAVSHVGGYLRVRPFPTVPRADVGSVRHYSAWYRACEWVAQPGNVAPDARFFTPSGSQTFKWYTGRPEVVNWKEVPQDARSIVRWWERLRDVDAGQMNDAQEPRRDSLRWLGAARLKRLGAKYDAGYVLTLRRPQLDLEVVYENEMYAIYRLGQPGGRQ